jgi:rhodanese-related sulfurtransferase
MISFGNHPIRPVVLFLAIVCGLVPIILYWTILGRLPNISVDKAKEILSASGSNAALVDVRTPSEYAANHIEAARNWPYDQIMALDSADGIPRELQGKRLFLLCESGILSALATERLRDLGAFDAANVQGGMQAWVGAAEQPCALGFCQLRAESGQSRAFPTREASMLEQSTAVATGFVVKPTYTILAFIFFVLLWPARSLELTALRWAMICFFVGENFCAANYLVYGERSVLFEYLHSYGMVLCFGLTAFAILEGIDHRLIGLSDLNARCAALGLCQRCVKHADVPCGFRRLFLFLIPAAAIVSLAPLCAQLAAVSYNTRIFGTFYNYSHSIVYQVFEVRYLPAVAALLLTASLLLLQFKRNNPVLWSKVFFAAGAGAIGFSFFRLVMFHAYRDNLVWYAAWEEITELLFIVGVGIVLWIFRHGLVTELLSVLPEKKASGKTPLKTGGE